MLPLKQGLNSVRKLFEGSLKQSNAPGKALYAVQLLQGFRALPSRSSRRLLGEALDPLPSSEVSACASFSLE